MSLSNGNGYKEIGAGDCLDLNVSASESSKGGVAYEVKLRDSSGPPPKINSPITGMKRDLSAEMIKQKLVAAAERRQSVEAEKKAHLAEKFRKIDEATKKKMEEEDLFKNSTQENLEKDIQTHIEKRETQINALKNKLSSHHSNHLQEVRENLETSLTEFEKKAAKDLESKLELYEKNRCKVIQERLEQLKKHDEQIEKVLQNKRNSSIVEPNEHDEENSK